MVEVLYRFVVAVLLVVGAHPGGHASSPVGDYDYGVALRIEHRDRSVSAFSGARVDRSGWPSGYVRQIPKVHKDFGRCSRTVSYRCAPVYDYAARVRSLDSLAKAGNVAAERDTPMTEFIPVCAVNIMNIGSLPGKGFPTLLGTSHSYDPLHLLRVSRSVIATKAIPCASFRADTLVLMADGTEKRISEVEIGDKVIATDPVTGKTSVRTVTRLFTHIDDDLLDLVVLTEDGVETIHTTDHHRFWNDSTKTWVEAKDLKSGERLLTADGDVVTVGDLKRLPGAAPMLDLTVEFDHTFYVALKNTAVLVHNQNWIPWSNARLGRLAGQLDRGADTGTVANRSEAEELFLRLYQGDGYVNTTGMSGKQVRDFYGSKDLTYHWDTTLTPGLAHNTGPHLQIHVPGDKIVRIYYGGKP